MKSAKKDWPTSSSRLLLEYLGFILFLLVLGTLIPELTRTATVALCLLIPLLIVTSPTPPSLFQTRWKATLQSLGDGCIASVTLLAVLLGAASLRGKWRPKRSSSFSPGSPSGGSMHAGAPSLERSSFMPRAT